MDRSEFKPKLDEIKTLTNEGKYKQAADIADQIPWRKIRNVNLMLRIAQTYENVGRFVEAKEILELAYDRSPVARMVVYELAMLGIRLGEYDEAQIYYDDFVEIAPHDTLKYVIKYHLNKAKGVDNATLISILEELKADDFAEEWVYELAYLYHLTKNAEKCIETCDELILWFGDGPYVERALELKMLYQPLDKQQEDKYRMLSQKNDGVIEINTVSLTGETQKTIRIPEVKVEAEKYDTLNLQTEIRKNIEEIINATESEDVSEKMENIKTLVGDIPYLQVDEEEKEQLYETIDIPKVERSIEDHFKELLAEEYDGQVSMIVPDTAKKNEDQVEGQMTIDEILTDWEKTRRAAAVALEEADKIKLEQVKAKALVEANTIMEKLNDVAPRLEAGVAPSELLKEEYLKKVGFAIPRVTPEGDVEGIIIPRIDTEALVEEIEEEELLKEEGAQKTVEAVEWDPPVLSEEKEESEPKDIQETPEDVPEEAVTEEPKGDSTKDDVSTVAPEVLAKANEIVSNANNILQQEIDRMLSENHEAEQLDSVEIENQDNVEEVASVEELVEAEGSTESDEAEEEKVQEELPEEKEECAIEDSSNPQDELEDKVVEVEEIAEEIKEEVKEEPKPTTIETSKLPTIELEPEAIEETKAEHIKELSPAQKECFAYFYFAKGMSDALSKTLAHTGARISAKGKSSKGNIIITGADESFRMQLATSIVKQLQAETNYPAGNIGKITGSALNEKDLVKLLSAVEGGTLIVEDAGKINHETAINLGLMLEANETGLLVILLGDKTEIQEFILHEDRFCDKFTERIEIPAYNNDELVRYAKTYAQNSGFIFDELATLALYNRIQRIKKADYYATVSDVREIMDDVLEKYVKGGAKKFFTKFKHHDEDGNIILQEKDFEL